MSYARSVAVLFAIASGAISATADEKPVEIPLDQIWSNAVRGARSLRSLEPWLNRMQTPEEREQLRQLTPEQIKARTAEAVKKSLVMQIERANMNVASEDKEAPPGFAVQGVGREALRSANRVLVQGKKLTDTLSAGDPISIVFYSLAAHPTVVVDRVERNGNAIDIHYVIRSTQHHLGLSWNLSLIPLGKLPRGKYHVYIVRSTMSDLPERGYSPLDPKFDRLIVCRPFDFTIVD